MIIYFIPGLAPILVQAAKWFFFTVLVFSPVGLVKAFQGISLYFGPTGEKNHLGLLGVIIYFLG